MKEPPRAVALAVALAMAMQKPMGTRTKYCPPSMPASTILTTAPPATPATPTGTARLPRVLPAYGALWAVVLDAVLGCIRAQRHDSGPLLMMVPQFGWAASHHGSMRCDLFGRGAGCGVRGVGVWDGGGSVGPVGWVVVGS